MKIFVSGEVSVGAGQGLRAAAVNIMDVANPVLAAKTYGGGLGVWYYLPIIFSKPLSGFGEVEHYNPSERYVEFKKNLDYSAFVNATHQERCRLIFAGLVRSIESARTMGIESFSFDDFERDLVAIGQANGWK